MAAEVFSSLHIVLPVIVGLIIGLIEVYFIYEDEGSSGLNGFFSKVWHGIIFSILGVLIVTNIPYIISMGFLPSFLEGWLFIDSNGISLVVCIIVALFMFIKIDMAHRMKGVGGSGFIEKPWHKLIIAFAIGFAPYYIIYVYPLLLPVQEIVPWIPF